MRIKKAPGKMRGAHCPVAAKKRMGKAEIIHTETIKSIDFALGVSVRRVVFDETVVLRYRFIHKKAIL